MPPVMWRIEVVVVDVVNVVVNVVVVVVLVVLVLVGRDRLIRPWTWLGTGRKGRS